MPLLRVVDSLSEPGNPARLNEDTFGGNVFCAFVIDGATGLGGRPLLDAVSDAAWLAAFARNGFETEIEASNSVADVVRHLNAGVLQKIVEANPDQEIEAWARPAASFQLVRWEGSKLATYGLGDCRMFLLGADGTAFETDDEHSEVEKRQARRAVAQAGGLRAWQSLVEQPSVREALRRSRARHNQSGGSVWSLGSTPEAASHINIRHFAPALPARGLLCTDGFSSLVDKYGHSDGAGLVRAACGQGLATLMNELRRIERMEDPDGLRYPRFKASDDATALLFEIAD